MSEKQFEDFLVAQFFEIESSNLKPGYRYQFQSPDHNNSQRLHRALIKNTKESITIKDTIIPVIYTGNVMLLPVLHSEKGDGFSENFISHLRDEVSGQQGVLKGSALLVIHNSMLDTLINSAENLAKLNRSWNPKQIKVALKGLIDPYAKERKVSECLLDHRVAQVIEDESTMFGFEELYKAILDGDLQFQELGLLNDPEILTWNENPAQINNRLAENKKLFDRISLVTDRFSSELEAKFSEDSFGEKFVKKHFSDDELTNWKNSLTFSDCLQEKKDNVTNVLVLEAEDCLHGKLIPKEKSPTNAGKRERHQILLLPKDQASFELKLTFLGGKIEKEQLKLQHTKDKSIQILTPDNSGGKRSKVTVIGDFTGEPLFFSLVLNREKTAERFKFRVLVLTKDSFYLPAFENIFLVEPNKKRITLQTKDNTLNISEQGDEAKLENVGQVFDNNQIQEIDFTELVNKSNDVNFQVKSNTGVLTFNIEGEVATDSLSLPLMLDTSRFVKLFNDEYFAQFNRNKDKVIIDHKEVAPKGRRLTLLQREAALVDDKLLSKRIDSKNNIELNDIKTEYPGVYKSYLALFSYLNEKNTLPSLSSWGDEFRTIVSSIVDEYNKAIASIGFDVLLTASEKTIVNIGYAQYYENGNKEYLTPYHPLVLAYQLSLATAIVKDNNDDNSSFKHLPKVTLQRLNARGLLPFIHHPIYDFSFTNIDNINCTWLELVPHQETSYAFVSKLVKDKVTEFKNAFSSLFKVGSKATLIINSVNNYENKEIFIGLVEYIKTQKDKVCHIHVNIYDDNETYCEFDRFSETSSYDELKSIYGLDKGAMREQADVIVDLLRTRLTYSKFRNDDCETKPQAYAHLSFFRNQHKVTSTDVNILEELSGVVCHGLLAGEAADCKENSYFTAFGLKNVDTANNAHLYMSQRLNGLIKPARFPHEQHSRSKSLALVVSDNFKADLERSYDNSIWTTIIDPKVTLDFFDSATDMVLIHYSDNYTNSTNYDAITVTKETELYRKVLEQDEGGIIEEFNAFNGEWLLKMITATENERKEKKGIIGAYKYINCLLTQSDITWVPLSIAEMLRVAGNIGLKMNDSDFSRAVNGYKSGAISDDVLFVGFKDKQLYLLPLEVKAGLKQTHNKGVKQAKELKRYLTEDILGQDNLASHLYRGLFIRQILMQVDKYKLYNLYKTDHFEPLLKEREWWLQGDYKLADLVDYPDGFLVAMVENDTFFEATFEEVENILKIQLPNATLSHLISTPLLTLMEEASSDTLNKIPEKYLLTKANSAKTNIDNNKGDNEFLDDRKKTPISIIEPDTPIEIDSVDNLKVLVGHNIRDDAPIYWEPTNTAKFMNTNSGIIGTMGTGKTQCTKAVVTQLYRDQHKNVDGKPIGILIFDYKSDYVDDKFIDATSGKKFKLFKLPYNPLSLFGDTPMLPIHTAAGFSETMAKAYGLGKKQQLKLENLILEAYELAGIRPEDNSTWSKPAPTIEQIWDLFLEQDKVDEDSLYAALSKLARFKIFETDPEKMMSLYELVDGVTVIELAGYPPEVQNLVVALTLDLFYSQMQKKGKPEVRGDFRQVTKLVLVDEADNFMSQNFASLRKILKEGREYGVGVILSTQDITHFKTSENDYSSYILSWIVHRVSQIKNQDIKSIFNKDDKNDQDNLMKSIRGLDKHYSLYVDGDKKITKIKDKAFWELLHDKY